MTESGLRRTTTTETAIRFGFFQMRTSIWNQGEYKGFS